MAGRRLAKSSEKRQRPPPGSSGADERNSGRQSTSSGASKEASVAAQTRKARIFLIDDHAVVRYGIGQLIDKQTDMMVCGEADNARDSLHTIATAQPDLAILDLTLKESSGLDLIRNLNAQFPHVRVLVVSMHDESVYAQMALRAGASGYLMKEEAIGKVLTAIRRVLSGSIYVSDAISAKMLEQQIRRQPRQKPYAIESLSARELEVLRLIGQWKGTRQIAGDLNLSVRTVEYYREQIKKKLNLKNSPLLVQYAVSWLRQHSS